MVYNRKFFGRHRLFSSFWYECHFHRGIRVLVFHEFAIQVSLPSVAFIWRIITEHIEIELNWISTRHKSTDIVDAFTGTMEG